MTTMFEKTTRSVLTIAFIGLLASTGAALGHSSGGGGGGGGGGSSGGGGGSSNGGGGGGSSGGGSMGGGGASSGSSHFMPSDQVCRRGLVYSQRVHRCVKAKSSGLTDQELFQQGRQLALAGYHVNALDVLDAVQNKHDAMVLTYIGYSHRKMGDTDVGIGFYKQALAIDPNNVNTHEYLGEGYASAGRIQLAKDELVIVQKLCGNTSCEQYEDLAAAVAGKPVE
ncbi:tetratricopeptide repeat protein [Kaistia granuli]|uniref:tetratricopeptide repeat protein n=1 Tax=Kaistia granuli TaxID=363259 RepID=UPI0003799E10|nr:tetratricopeptide repeat protein [Kaistia granuli]